MPEAVSVLILKAAVVKAVEVMIQKVVNSNWNKQFDEGKEILLELKSDWPRNNYLERHVQSSLKIRTLLNPNDDITLDEIYYPLTLNTASNKDQVVIGDSQTLNFSGAINIIGIAGQGKSTILRKLFLEEIKQAERIPFFIELRNVEDGDILSHFKEVLKSFQIVITDSNVEYLLQSGKVVLLLDGFDEVRQKLATKTLNSIKNIMSSYACPVIITSRPNTEVCTCPGIYNMTVEGINLVDKIRILNIIENRDVNSNSTTFRYLCELLISNNSFAETICNPIMVTLLYHCFPYMDEVPKDISEFYRQLFGVLYARHDRIKGYTTRERESEIDVEPAREFFSLISLKSLIREEYELNSYNLHKYVKSALETGGYNPKKADAFINDLVKITCLLQTDGNDRYVFLHKSVQEFFAAFYISTMQEKYLKEKVYIILRKTVRSSEKLDNLLHFLFHLDKKNFIDEITLETFKESQFKDFADLNYDDFSLPFDRMLKGIFIRGESRKKDYEIILSCHNSMDKILNLSFLNVINGRERTIDGNLELPLLEKLKNGLNKSDLDKYKEYKIIETPENDKLNIVRNNSNHNHYEMYTFSLIEFLKNNDIYNYYKNMCFDAIGAYNDNVYKIKFLESLELKAAMDDSFDFL